MRKIIFEWVVSYYKTHFGGVAEATTSLSELTEDQISELVTALNEEYTVQLRTSDITANIEKFGDVSVADLAAMVFAKCI